MSVPAVVPSATEGGSRRHVLATARGGGFLAGGHFFEIASRFGIAVLLARAIGAADYGMYALALSAGALFAGTGGLGLDDAMVRYVAILSRRGDEPGVRGTVQIGLGISTVASVLIAVALALLAEPVAIGLFDEPALASLLRLMAVLVPFMTVSNVLAAIARGFKRMDYAALAENVVMSLARLTLIAVLAVVGLDVVAAVVIYGVSDIAASITLIVLLNRRLPFRGLVSGPVRRDYADVFGFALPLWISGLLLQFRKNIEVLLLGALSIAANVGVFAVASRINMVGHVLYQSTVASVKPVLAELHGDGDRTAMRQVYRTSTRWTFMCNLPVFVVTVLYAEQILSVFGATFVTGATALTILACAELANAATGTCGSILDMTGHVRVKLVNSVVWIAVLLSCNLAFIPRWGLLGAATAALVSTALINLMRVLEVWVLESLQPFDRTFWKPAVAALVAFGVGRAMVSWPPTADGLFGVAVGGLAVAATYAAVCVALRLAPDDRAVVDGVVHKVRSRGWSAVLGRRAQASARLP